MNIKIKKLRQDATIPTRGSEYAAGYDLYALLDDDTVTIQPHMTLLVNTGVAVEIPDGYFGAIYARSGLALKKSLRPANAVGVIDSDYRGEIKVALHNDSDVQQTVQNGDRIAQLVVQPYLPVEFVETKELPGTYRGDGGFGHTGR